MKYTKILAHRGASAYAPENTMAAFKKAIEMNADGIELDVHLSKDGYIVIIHDERVDRTTDGKGEVKDFSLDELRRLDAGSWFSDEYKDEKIPTLEELLKLIKNTELYLNIEIKAGYRAYPNIEEKVIAMIEKYKMLDRVVISSFDHYSLVRVKEINSNIKTGMLYEAALYEPWEYARSIKVEALHPNYITLTKEFIDKAYINNFEVNPYTINDEANMKSLIKNKVTSIITNYPDRAYHIISKLKLKNLQV
ncbi:glycerophosphodiester phosphodiesterase [Clostridium botulinum]|uniref:Glycerophosphodiester phosphodiesterase n=1 Tax=Clostridium botulinum TaxID=1491 RepID=A0A6B4ZMH2_CLOBO|nr:glycerophosphodiester phosphodiesterase [Clostridium botulinum]KRU25235.1 glycerophosphoryl diester phosphodiesterase [Clostridium sporogenes]KRU28112.1 glycerophosphoryl diester phosphodiesterase [Clostridium sporogenes]KRU28818.1 glycerophosphoryl diester phosphodiesterase [Clostridium sporogenes]KRU40279.1 glycerophosphoryl diester phosphodiesterase [Clostridium sporogenes]MBZ1329846.1 glycerophosphodiester phosphodiesterase [Clostridium botulinum]